VRLSQDEIDLFRLFDIDDCQFHGLPLLFLVWTLLKQALFTAENAEIAEKI
jgi:hypothetical protein